jgi:hypothetical protein
VEEIRLSMASPGDFYETLPDVPLARDLEKPSDAPFSAAILYMLDSRASRVWDTLASLETLARNVPFEHPYHILLLQSGDFDDPVLQEAMVARWLERIDELRLASEKTSVLQRMETMAELIEFVRVDFTPNIEAMRLGVEGLNPFFPTVWPGEWDEIPASPGSTLVPCHVAETSCVFRLPQHVPIFQRGRVQTPADPCPRLLQ